MRVQPVHRCACAVTENIPQFSVRYVKSGLAGIGRQTQTLGHLPMGQPFDIVQRDHTSSPFRQTSDGSCQCEPYDGPRMTAAAAL